MRAAVLTGRQEGHDRGPARARGAAGLGGGRASSRRRCAAPTATSTTGGSTPRSRACPGHDFAGRVESVGDGVDETWIGAPVAVKPSLPCGDCAECAAGQAAGLQAEEADRAVVRRVPDREGRGAGGQPRAAARGRRGVAGLAAGTARRRAQHRRPAADHARRDGARARAGPDRAGADAAVRAVGRRSADRHRRPRGAVRGVAGLRRHRLHQRRRDRREAGRGRPDRARRGRGHRDRDLGVPGVVGDRARRRPQGGQGRAHRLGQRPAPAARSSRSWRRR